MKLFYSMIATLFISILVIIVGCESSSDNNDEPSNNDDERLFTKDIGVRYLNDYSYGTNVVFEVISTEGDAFRIYNSTVMKIQRDSCSGFTLLATPSWSGLTIGSIMTASYKMSEVEFGRQPHLYRCIEIMVYRDECPNIPNPDVDIYVEPEEDDEPISTNTVISTNEE